MAISMQRLRDLRNLAHEKFVGHGPVKGVGIGNDHLVFLLEVDSEKSRMEINEWAHHQQVQVKIQVTGRITLIKHRL